MASDSDITFIIKIGQQLLYFKLFVASVTTLWVYDYFLTLADEVRYAWKMERRFIFALFLVSRYLPPVFQIWSLVAMHYPGYTADVCQKTAFLQIVYNMIVVGAAQIVLTQRTYAITGKNKWVAGVLYAIFTTQVGVTIYAIVFSATNPIPELPSIPLDIFHLCPTAISKPLTVLTLALTLAFDVSVFLLVIIQRRLIRSRYQVMSGPDILSRLSRDTEVYFVVIATSHFVIVVMYAAVGTPPSLTVGNQVYIPMLISRMIISLKKVASSRETHLAIDTMGAVPTVPQGDYTSRQAEAIRLSTFQ